MYMHLNSLVDMKVVHLLQWNLSITDTLETTLIVLVYYTSLRRQVNRQCPGWRGIKYCSSD